MINNPFNSINIKPQQDSVFEHLSSNSGSKTAIEYKGSLVHENPIQAAGSNIKALGNDVVNLGKALKDGQSSDHSLGRLNDMGMKLSAVGIATYLLTRRNTPKAKIMEFAGAGVFFTMMNLWQKLFIAAPIKARFGVDINQKYIDSQGKRKDLGQDNQYKPNIRTREEKEALADRMGLPKDMEFRGEYAEEKERRITLQGRTLNMLTAGVATPVMTALICNRIEKYIDEPVAKLGILRADRDANHLDAVVNKKLQNPLFARKGTKIIESYADYSGKVDDKFFKNLADAFNPVNTIENAKITKNMPDFSGKIAHDLENMFASSLDKKETAEDIYDLFTKYAKVKGKKITVKVKDPDVKGGITKVTINKKDLQKAIDNVVKKVKKGKVEYSSKAILDALSTEKSLRREVSSVTKGKLAKDLIKNLEENRMEELLDEGNLSLKEIRQMFKDGTDTVLNDRIKDAEELCTNVTVNKKLYALPVDLMSKEGKKSFGKVIEHGKQKHIGAFMEKVKENFLNVRRMGATMSSVDGVIKSVDNSFGKEYFNIVDSIFDVMKPDKQELEKLRTDADYASKYMEKALREIAGDNTKYNKLFMSVVNSPIQSEAKRKSLIKALTSNARRELDKSAQGLDPSLKTLRRLSDVTTSTIAGFSGDIRKYVSEALPGIDATRNRVLLTLDLEKRIKDGTLKKQWKKIKAQYPDVKVSYSTLVDDCRKILYKSTPGDFANTNYIKGNGVYYEALNNVMFNQPMSKSTKSLLKGENSGLLKQLDKMRVSLMAFGSKGFGNKRENGNRLYVSDYKHTSNIINGDIIKSKKLRKVFTEALADPDAVKYQKIGKPLKNFTFENAGQIFNSKTWMRIFAPIAMGLTGVTLLAQAFIGRDKDMHLYMTKRQPQGAANGNK